MREDLVIPEIPFLHLLGIEIDLATSEEVRGHLPWSPQHRNGGGVVHGGALMTLADALGAVCAFLNLPAGKSTATIDSHSHFLRAVRSGSVEAVSRPVQVGGRIIVVQTDLTDSNGALAVRVLQTQAVLDAIALQTPNAST